MLNLNINQRYVTKITRHSKKLLMFHNNMEQVWTWNVDWDW